MGLPHGPVTQHPLSCALSRGLHAHRSVRLPSDRQEHAVPLADRRGRPAPRRPRRGAGRRGQGPGPAADAPVRDVQARRRRRPRRSSTSTSRACEKGEAAEVLPLEQLRAVDALAHVVRAFHDEAVPHVEGPIDPARDAATMETELILADHTIAERRLEKLELNVKKTNKDEDKKELELLRRVPGGPRARDAAAQPGAPRGRRQAPARLHLPVAEAAARRGQCRRGRRRASSTDGAAAFGLQDAGEPAVHRGRGAVGQDRGRDRPARYRRRRRLPDRPGDRASRRSTA